MASISAEAESERATYGVWIGIWGWSKAKPFLLRSVVDTCFRYRNTYTSLSYYYLSTFCATTVFRVPCARTAQQIVSISAEAKSKGPLYRGWNLTWKRVKYCYPFYSHLYDAKERVSFIIHIGSQNFPWHHSVLELVGHWPTIEPHLHHLSKDGHITKAGNGVLRWKQGQSVLPMPVVEYFQVRE